MKNQKNIAQTLKIIALAVALSFGLSYVYAWTAPTSLPPGGNTSAPINTATSTQIKSGALGVTNFVANSVTVGGTPNAGAVTSPKFCIGASCITAWPAGGGAVTSIIAGTGITVSPTGGTGAVTVNATASAGTSIYSCPSYYTAPCGGNTCTGFSTASTCSYRNYSRTSVTAAYTCSGLISVSCSYLGKLWP
jgi:hypothetical protein